MSIFERIAQSLGCTFHVQFARSAGLHYINVNAIITGIIVIAAIVVIIAGICYIKEKVKKH